MRTSLTKVLLHRKQNLGRLFSDDIYPAGLDKISEPLAIDSGMYETTAYFLRHAVGIGGQPEYEDGSENYPEPAMKRNHSVTFYPVCYARSITPTFNCDSENRIAAIKY